MASKNKSQDTKKEEGPKIVIIGSGPCGLGAAYRCQELGHENFVVLEAGSEAGGLSITATDENGFLWDMGGHVIFSHYQYFDALLDHVNSDWCERERVCYVWQKGRFIPYPYQNNIHRLPQEDLQKCMEGLIELERKKHSLPPPKNFLEWLQNGFGKGILDLFLVPYNRKVWGYDPSEMNTEWMGERVATVDLARITSNILSGKDDASWGPNNTFRFPLRGGTGTIWQQLYEKVEEEKFVFDATVVGVDADAKVVHLKDGRQVAYDHLISSMPLDKLCVMTKGEGLGGLPAKAPEFRYSSTHVVGIGLEGVPPAHLKHQCWMYFPEDDCPFYRVTVFSNYSPYHVPQPGKQWSLMAEVCETNNRPVDTSKIVEQVLQGFYNTQLLDPARDKVVSRFHRRLEYGYPTPFYGREELCVPIFEALEKKDIWSRGRFGAWKYEVSNQDHTMMQGVECVDHVLFGSEEMTFRFPSVVNGRNWKGLGRKPRVCVGVSGAGETKMKNFDPLMLAEKLATGMRVDEAEAEVLVEVGRKKEVGGKEKVVKNNDNLNLKKVGVGGGGVIGTTEGGEGGEEEEVEGLAGATRQVTAA